MREERRTVTTLFADVVGSTEMGERLDKEEARLILNEAMTRVITAIERYGGTVKDLAGDGVFALFGAPIAHEDDAERALHAALEIIDAAAEHSAQLKSGWGIESFSMRIGIDAGEVVLGPVGGGDRVEYGAVGDPVNTASRLQAQAEPGAILVSATASRPAESKFRWGPPSSLTLKGKAAPVEVRQLLGPESASQVQAAAAGPLIGRESELKTTQEALQALARGQGSVLFLSGNPGIGKSRLVGELRKAAAAAEDVRWHEGRCVSYGESMPYWPYRDLLRDLLGVGPRDPQMRIRVNLRRQLEELFGERQSELGPYLASLLGAELDPDDAARLQQLSPESRQFRTFEVVRELIEALASSGALVLVLEDLHWADPTSIQLTEQLLALTESVPLLIVITHRDERDHPSWTLREVAAREYPHLYREVVLGPLTVTEQERLVTALTMELEVSVELRGRIAEYAEGNPFFVEQLIESIRDPAGDRLQVPATLEELILARVDRLTDGSREVLTAAAPLGRSFGLSLIEHVAGRPAQEVQEALHQLQRLDLVREERRWPEAEYRFKHALIQETVYRTLLAPRRRALHALAAGWLEERHGSNQDQVYGLLAHHWLQAEDEDRAIRYLGLAADHAREQWSLDEAIDHYRELVKLLLRHDRGIEASEALFKLGLALHTAMRYGEANAVWQQAFASAPGSAPVRRERTALLRIAGIPVPASADPHPSIGWADIQLAMQLNDRLVEAWPRFNIVPSLATGWEVSDDGLRYLIHLRSDAAWSDGTPLVAAEVVEAIRRQLDPASPGAGASIYFCLEQAAEYLRGVHSDPERIGARALDSATLELRLAAPAPYLLNILNRPDANAWRGDGSGTGPFRLESLDEKGAVLSHVPAYSQPRAGNVARVEWLRMSPNEAVVAFAEDRVDLVLIRTGLVPAGLGSRPPAAGEVPPATTSVFAVIDCRQRPGADLSFRRALAQSVARKQIEQLEGLPGEPATGGIVPPALPGHTPGIAPRFAPDQARQALAESGFAGQLRVGTLGPWEPIAHELAAGWHDELGIEVVVERFEHARAAFAAGCQVMLYNWLPGYPDADYYLRLLLHSESHSNLAGWKNPEFDRLIEEARLKTAAGPRLALFHEADRLAVQDDCVMIPLLYYRPFHLSKPWLSGYWEWGKSSASFADLVVDRSSPRYDTKAELASDAKARTPGRDA